jgi:hypothetical protein
MDPLQTRLDALEQRTHTVERQLRWWRGLAGGLLALAVLTGALPTGTAQEDAITQGDKEKKGLEQRIAALESLLKHFSREKNEVFLTGANFHIVNGLGRTNCPGDENGNPLPGCPNGLGNLIVGYNELRMGGESIRTGSHNVVVGQEHNFTRVGGLVVGLTNTISGDFSVVSGGSGNTASGNFAAVSGGAANTATGLVASVSGGGGNTASGDFSSVSGGGFNAVDEEGVGNMAVGVNSTVSGGSGNTASGNFSAVSGGLNRTAEGEFDWVAGSLVEDD